MSDPSTIALMNDLYPDLYQDTLFVARHETLMANLVTHYEARGWMDRHVPIYGQAEATDIGESQDFTGYQEWEKSTLVSYTPGEVITGYACSDRRLETDPDDLRRDAAQEMGAAIAQKLDQDILGDFADFDGTVGYCGSYLTIQRMAAALAILVDEKVGAGVVSVLAPSQWFRVWVELGSPTANQAFLGDAANQALMDYYRSSILGPPIFVSGNIENVAVTDGTRGTATAASKNAALGASFHKSSLALDTRRRPRTELERSASLRAFTVTITTGYAHGTRRSNRGVAILSENNLPTDV